MNPLKNLEPRNVFKFFYEISQIPRGSGNEKAISEWLVAFAKERGLRYIQDSALNVVIFKDAALGREADGGLVFQCHMDMVCEKTPETNHNFATDPIKLFIDGDYIKADGTTLGADDGYGMAYQLALLDGNYNHPKIAAIFTVEEETTMKGAYEFDGLLIKDYKYMISLDGGGEVLIVGCSGSIQQNIHLPIIWEAMPLNHAPYTLSVSGLVGGHSGSDINKGLGNANKLLGRALNLLDEIDIRIVSIRGGLADNAIPREAFSHIAIPKDKENEAIRIIKGLSETLQAEYSKTEPFLALEITPSNDGEEVFSHETKCELLAALLLMPNGVLEMSTHNEGLVETSNNLGIVETTESKVLLTSLTRSQVLTKQQYAESQFKTLAMQLGAEYEQRNYTPAWQYSPDSQLIGICEQVYDQIWGKKPLRYITQGCTESGIFYEKNPHIQIVGVGPFSSGLHSPEEKLDILSTEKVWGFILKLLETVA